MAHFLQNMPGGGWGRRDVAPQMYEMSGFEMDDGSVQTDPHIIATGATRY